MVSIPSSATSQIGPWHIDDVDSSARSIKSAERTLALFELFSLHQGPLTVGEISKELGMPQPSVTMLVKNLVKLGYLEHDRFSRTYTPTIRIMLLGSWLHRRINRQGDLETHLDRLLAEVGETVVVGIQNGIYSQYVCAQMPEDPTRMEVQSGLLRPITRTAIGRALLSLKPDAEVAMTARRCNAEVSAELRFDLTEFANVIGEVRKNGYAETDGDMTKGLGAIAVTVDAPIGTIPIAVGVGAPAQRIKAKKEAVLSALQEFKKRIEGKSSTQELRA